MITISNESPFAGFFYVHASIRINIGGMHKCPV